MDGRGKKILVAEDYVSNRNPLACLLEQAQYEVHLAGDGYEALERMFNGVFDAVIIVDGHMPGFSGHEFAEFCRSAWPVTPVILLSGDRIDVTDHTDEGDSAACLRKPFEAAMLLSVLRTVLTGFERTGHLLQGPDNTSRIVHAATQAFRKTKLPDTEEYTMGVAVKKFLLRKIT